jgi:hypothetical protein
MFVSRSTARLEGRFFRFHASARNRQGRRIPVVSGLLETILGAARQAKELRQKRTV